MEGNLIAAVLTKSNRAAKVLTLSITYVELCKVLERRALQSLWV